MKSESLGPEMSLYVYRAQALQVFLFVAKAENHSFIHIEKYMSGLWVRIMISKKVDRRFEKEILGNTSVQSTGMLQNSASLRFQL